MKYSYDRRGAAAEIQNAEVFDAYYDDMEPALKALHKAQDHLSKLWNKLSDEARGHPGVRALDKSLRAIDDAVDNAEDAAKKWDAALQYFDK